MPIKIHHGPPGSFKTAGAIADDFLREAKAGRVIVTNCRGVSRERTLEQFPDLPDSFDVVFVDDKTSEGRQRWATWFHWVPHGAFIMVDEVQDIWPKRWKEADIRGLDYPGGVDKATADDRPKDWEQALDKHRHYNWDMTLTCPSYAKVRDDIKGIADMAYKHKDLGLLGWSGRYIEGAHAADDTGKNASDFVNVQNKKVPKYVFTLYDSTQTGLFSGSKSGFNLFANPRIAMLLAIVICLGAWVSTRPVPKVLGGSGEPLVALGASGAQAAPLHTGAPSPVAGAALAGGANSADDAELEALQESDLYLLGSFQNANGIRSYVFRWKNVELGMPDLLDLGFTVVTKGSCAVQISKGAWRKTIICGRPDDSRSVVGGSIEKPQERHAAPVSSVVAVPSQAQAERPNIGG